MEDTVGISDAERLLEINSRMPGVVQSTIDAFLPNMRPWSLFKDVAITALPTIAMLTAGDPAITRFIWDNLPVITLNAYLASRAIENLPKLAENAAITVEWAFDHVYEAVKLFTPHALFPDKGERKWEYFARSLGDFLLPALVTLGAAPTSAEALLNSAPLYAGAYLVGRIVQRAISAALHRGR